MLLGLAMGCSDDATGQTGRDDHGATGATSVGPGTDGGSTSDGETTSSSLETGDDADSSGSTGGPEVGCPPGADDCVEPPQHQLL